METPRGSGPGSTYLASPLLQQSNKRPRTSETWNQRNPYQQRTPAASAYRPGAGPRSTPLEAVAPFTAPPAAMQEAGDGSTDLYEYLAARRETQVSQEQEIAELKAKADDLQRRLSRSEQERRTVAAESEAKASRWQRDEKELESALQEASLRAAAAAQRCEKVEAKAAEQRSLAASTSQNLREELQVVETAAAEAQRELAMAAAKLSEEQLLARDAARRAKTALEREQSLVETADAARRDSEGRLGRLEVQLAEAEGRAAAAERRCIELEAEARASASGARGGSDSSAELQVLRKELHSAQAEAAQVKVLRQHVANTDLLREQLAGQESRCRRLQQELEAAHAAQPKLAEAEAALALWQSAAAALGGGCKAPEDLPRRAAELQRESLSAAEMQGAAHRDAERLRVKVMDLEESLAGLQSKDLDMKRQLEEAANALARERRKVSLLQGERDSLKSILASYDEEKDSLMKSGETPSTDALRAKGATERAEELQLQVTSLEKELSAKALELRAAQEKSVTQTERLAAAQALRQRLEAEAQRLGSEVALLSDKLGRGEFDPTKTKVLHLIANPEALALKAAEESATLALSAERDALEAQVVDLQARLDAAGVAATGGGGGAATPGSAAPSPAGGARQIAVLEAEKVVLQRQVAEIEKRELRLKEVFRERIQAFREACYQIFGYRVDMASESSSRGAGAAGAATSFVLKPAKADSKDDHLMFRFTQAGGMEMLDTPFTTQPSRQQEVETFIGKFRSIPAFTANLTMELFQKQTQC